MNFQNLTQLYSQNVSEAILGHTAWVESESTLFEAIRPGHGADCWEARQVGGVPVITSGRIQAYRRVVDHADPDVAVEDTTATIDLGSALPTGAIVLAVIGDNTEDWTDGSSGTFSIDVGTEADPDKFSPTALDIDNGVALLTQSVAVPASGDQVAIEITSSVDLDTATGGTTDLTVLFTVPSLTTFTAADEE